MKLSITAPILAFFGSILALSAPLWWFSGTLGSGGMPDHLPVTDALATFVPLASALFCTLWFGKVSGCARLVGRLFDAARSPLRWYGPVLFLFPFWYIVTALVQVWLGLGLPPSPPASVHPVLLFLMFFFAAAGEELGYMGFAADELLKRKSPLTTGLILGIFWAAWHIPSMLQVGQNAMLMLCGLGATVALRVIYTWLYVNNGRSVFAIVLIHAVGNTGRSLFPGGREAFERLDGLIGYGLILITALAVGVIGWKTMGRPLAEPPASSQLKTE